jgi:hypothetical protein
LASVLSTISGRPCLWAICDRLDVDERAARIGQAFDKDRPRLGVDLLFEAEATSSVSAQRTSQPKFLKALPNWLIEPP